jgi:hypothetical protein
MILKSGTNSKWFMSLFWSPLLLLIMPSILSSRPVEQKPQPSLQETLQWLKETFADHGTYTWESNLGAAHILEKRPVSFDGCAISWVDRRVMSLRGAPFSTSTYQETVPLAEIDAATIRAEKSPYSKLGDPGSFVGLSTLAGKTAIKSKDLSDGEIHSYEGTMIWFDSQGIAERVAKALTHASNLCRQSQPF